MDAGLGRSLPAQVTVEHERLGETLDLSEYLVPAGLMNFVVLYALVFLPY